MGRGQNTNINRSLGEGDSSPHRWLWGIQDFREISHYRCGRKKKKELELEVEPKNVAELLQSHETPKDEELLLTEQRKWFLEMESTSGKKMMRRLLKW